MKGGEKDLWAVGTAHAKAQRWELCLGGLRNSETSGGGGRMTEGTR